MNTIGINDYSTTTLSRDYRDDTVTVSISHPDTMSDHTIHVTRPIGGICEYVHDVAWEQKLATRRGWISQNTLSFPKAPHLPRKKFQRKTPSLN